MMRGMFNLCALISAISFISACGGAAPPASDGGTNPGIADAATNVSAGNRAACIAYVNQYNGLSCVMSAGRLDPNMVCPASLDTNGCNAKPYYQCISNALVCKTVAGISYPDPSAGASCMSPCR